jgi:hypothetical protein
MSLANYSDLQAAIGAWLDHSIFAAQYPTFVTLFESTANRRLRVRAMEVTTILVPSTPAQLPVSNAANNGSGAIRLTISGTSTLATGQEVNVANVSGTTEANGSWIITVVDGFNIDLQGSTFTNAYQSGTGTVSAQPGIAPLPSDYLAWRRVTCTAAGTSSNTGNNSGTSLIRSELGYVHPSYLQSAYPSHPADVPRVFTIEGANLKVMPLSGAPLEFDYFQKIPSLITNSTNWLMTTHPDVYLFGSMAEAEAFGVNDERMPMWKARRDEIFEEIIRLDTKTRGPAFVRVFGVTP